MTEIYEFEDKSMFSHLLLEGEGHQLLGEGFDPNRMRVELKINGCDVLIKDFNEVLSGWCNRIENQVRLDLDLLKEENAVSKKAEALLKDKLGEAYTFLSKVEEESWRLYD